QAEDGIRDKLVTGVQTCALPIWKVAEALGHLRRRLEIELVVLEAHPIRFRDNRPGLQTEQDVMGLGVVAPSVVRIVGGGERNSRSEERRVGKEGRARWEA